jgi:hypothetical protein
MYESARLNVDHVIGPQGLLTAADLPTPHTKRCTVARKAEVVALFAAASCLSRSLAAAARSTNRSSYQWSIGLDPKLCSLGVIPLKQGVVI